MPPYHVPSGATISGLCPLDVPQNELQEAVQVSFKHKGQVVGTTMCLLSLFNSPGRPEITSNISSLVSDAIWIFNTLTLSWEAVASKSAQLDCADSALSSTISLLDHVRVFNTRTRTLGLNTRSAVVNRMSILYFQITTRLLVMEPVPLPSSIEKRLCLMLFDLALTDPKSGRRLESFAENIISNVLGIKQNYKRFDALSQDLQVGASRRYFRQLLTHKPHRMPCP